MGETGVGKEQFARAIHRGQRPPGQVRGHQLRRPARDADRERAVRLRQGGPLAGRPRQAGAHRRGRARDAVPRRVRGDHPGGAGQAAAFPGEEGLPAAGLDPHAPGRHAACWPPPTGSWGRCGQDIAARLGPEPIRLPPLREHPEDIAALASHFLRERPGLGLEVSAFQALCLARLAGQRARPAQGAHPRGRPGRRPRAAARSASHAPARGPGAADGRRPTAAEPPPPQPAEAPRGSPAQPPRRPHQGGAGGAADPHDWVVSQAAREIDRDHAVVWRWIKRYGLDVDRARD